MENDWERDSLSLKDRMSLLLRDERSADVKFTFPKTEAQKEPTTIHAHKSILGNASIVFEKMFYGDLKENTEQAIKIEDIESKTFAIMLEFIYTEKLELDTWDVAAKVFGAAQKYMLNFLGMLCIGVITNKLEAKNSLKIFEFARFYDENELMDAALKIIRKQTLFVFENPDFNEIEIDTMMIILDQDELQANEMDLYYALEFLCAEKMRHGYQTDKGALSVFLEFQKAIKKIDFSKITAEQFLNGPALSHLLWPKEVSDILACLIQPSCIKYNYPKNFARNIRKKILPRLFFDITVDGLHIGRILIELRDDVLPKTIKSFLLFCTGERISGFKGSHYFSINSQEIKAATVDFPNYLGMEFENFILKHNKGAVGLIIDNEIGKSIVNLFYITTSSNPNYCRNRYVIGTVVEGMDVATYISKLSSESGIPLKKVEIVNCGLIDFRAIETQ